MVALGSIIFTLSLVDELILLALSLIGLDLAERSSKAIIKGVTHAFVAFSIINTIVGIIWALIYGGFSFFILRYYLKISYDTAVGTAFLVSASAFFERTHIERSAQKMEDNLNKMVDRFFHHKEKENK